MIYLTNPDFGRCWADNLAISAQALAEAGIPVLAINLDLLEG